MDSEILLKAEIFIAFKKGHHEMQRLHFSMQQNCNTCKMWEKGKCLFVKK